MLGKTQSDELNRDFSKLNVAFTLPPGSYATLVIKRLFHFAYREETVEEVMPRPPRPSLEERRQKEGFLARQKQKKAARTDAREPSNRPEPRAKSTSRADRRR